MALSNDRVVARGLSPHPHERAAVDFAIQALPDRDPLRLWALVDLVDNSGRRYDLDLVVIGYHAVYLIEIKSHLAAFSGDVTDWRVDFHDGGTKHMDNPLGLTALKARVLASLLERKLGPRRPYVQELVFLSDPKVQVKFQGVAAHRIVTRQSFERAITFGQFSGASPKLLNSKIDRPLARDITKALKDIGLRESIASRKVNDLVLEDVLLDRQSYQDHLARNERLPDVRSRVRTYQVAHGTTEERRQQLLRAAEREARMLAVLSDHPSILKLRSYVPEGPTGAPCVVFEHFEGGVPLDMFLRAHPDLSLHDRSMLLQMLAEALSYCHRKKVLHRGLAPSAVLVRRNADTGKLELRLFNFQLAATPAGGAHASGTSHLTQWVGASEDVYVAPEVLENAAHASEASDVFSLGAIAYLVLTGRPPGETLAERAALMVRGYLSLATGRDDLAGGVSASDEEGAVTLDAVMEMATALKSVDRDEDPLSWVGYLTDALTAPTPAPAQAFVDPLTALKGDEIGPDMRVEAVLGTGSTARTLRVRTKEGLFALKVALPEHNERVAREGEMLRKLHSDRIVHLFEQHELQGRVCLRMTDAGQTLADLLAEQGAQSLDYARRWGEDLLLALTHLEEEGVQHRDIKPGNLGVLSGEQKKRRHLLLFDFSLSAADMREVRAGTPAYRDPFLAQRGRWDDHADRYAAAITLHELLTGDRPRWGDDDVATAIDTPITLAAERFDAGVRERLAAFFQKAFARTLEERFESADAMRTEWLGCFASYLAPVVPAVEVAVVPATGDSPTPEPAPLPKGLALDTPVEALPLTTRAKNALDRAGVLDVRDLLGLPNNQLSAMPGVGRDTTRSILELIRRPELEALCAELESAARAGDALSPEYAGPATAVQFVNGLSAGAAQTLRQAGVSDLTAVALTGRARLARILKAHEGALEALVAALQQAQQAALNARASSVESWLERFLPSPQKRGDKPLQHVRAVFGLDPVNGHYLDSVASVAAGLGVTRALVHAAVGKVRESWAERPELAELRERLEATLEPLFGMAPLEVAGEALARALSSEDDGAKLLTGATVRAGKALVRVALEGHPERKLARVGERLWVVPEALDAKELSELGKLADELAQADPLLSPGAVEERLRTGLTTIADAESALSQVPTHRLVALAAWASHTAAKSARLELYPRGLSHVRALDLCVGALPAAKLTPELLQNIVRARYPEAQALPEGDALRLLMDARGYRFDAAQGAFERKRPHVERGTEGPLPRSLTTHTGHRGPDPDAYQFAEDIKVREKRGSFCVLEVAPAYAQQTALELARRLQVKPLSLEAALLAEMRKQAAALGVDTSLVYATDRAGKQSSEWPNLRELMRQAGTALLESLHATSTSLVLTDPGLIARYQLEELVRGLVSRTREDDAPAIFLIVPASDEAGGARISHPEGDLPIPLTSPAQRLRVPKAWIQNLDRSRAS